MEWTPAAEVDAHQEALRIQVAAVAAQQAALLDEEARLQQQQTALNQQQDQLASHLEEKRQQLLDIAEHVQAARAAWKRERDDHDRRLARHADESARQQSELEAARKQLHHERLRLKRLRRRLKQRLHRRVVAERHLVRQREAEVAAARQRLEQERQSLRQEREVVTQVRLRASGDVEFGKRQLQEEWDALRKAQQQWQCQREEQEAELTQRGRALRRGEDALADAERALGDDRYAWESRRKHREQERDGLEARIVNQRRKLAEQQAALQQLEAQRPAPEPPVSAAKLPVGEILEGVPAHEAHLREIEAHINRRAAALERVAGDLDDQRLELVEHWQRAAQVQDDWQRTHAAVVEHLESLTAAFPQREQALLTRQRALDGAEALLGERQQELSRLRQHLEGRAARLRLCERGWQSERQRLLAELRARDELAGKHWQKVVELRQRWAARRKQELEQLQAERTVCEQVRQEYATLRQEYWKRGLALEMKQRELAEQTLAVEEYRQHFIVRAPDAAAAEGRLERIQKRWAQQNAAAMRDTAEQFRRLGDEAAAVHQRGRELLKVAEELAQREAALARRQTAWEEALALAEAEQANLRQQLQSALVQRERCERQIAELQAEVERVARVLLEEADAPGLALGQAA